MRKIGAWLDSIQASQINIIEVDEAVAVRYARQDIEAVVMQRYFTKWEIESLRWSDLHLRRKRGLHGSFSHEEGGYQDLLRSLGHKLDRLVATLVHIDEVDDELVVTYLTSGESGLSAPSRHTEKLGPEGRETLRKEALTRRRAESRWRLLRSRG
jgi:hypothetical protein